MTVALYNSFPADAQHWSYVYIQGDKQIPFYVKLEGEMLPRYSKNYYIIPELEAGPIHLQILFQQNQYPPQNFTVLVPENGYRGFLLTRKDNSFSLYDIQQRFYLMPGEAGEDHLPEMISVTSTETKETVITKEKEDKPAEKKVSKTKKAKETKEGTTPANEEPQFLEDVVLDNIHNPQNNTATTETSLPDTIAEMPNDTAAEQYRDINNNEPYTVAQETAVEETPQNSGEEQPVPEAQINIESHTAPIINSDCPRPLNAEDFDKLYSNTKEKNDDEKRVSYLMKKAEDDCFTTRQAYFLAKELHAESMRYSFLKKVYPRITDQQNFHLLEDHLFRTLEWKSYFRLIYQ